MRQVITQHTKHMYTAGIENSDVEFSMYCADEV